MVNNYPTTLESFKCSPHNYQFNRNFAIVLYELKKAGVRTCCFLNQKYAFGSLYTNNLNLHINYLSDYRKHVGLRSNECGFIDITYTLINGLAS